MKINHRYIIGAIAFIVALILQTTVLKHIAVLGYSPNLLLSMVVVCSFLYEEKIGLIYGAIFGLILDMVSSFYIGPSAIGFVVVYAFVRIMRMFFNHERLLPELLLAVGSTPLFLLVVWAFYKMASAPISIIVILKAMPILIVYNGIIIVLLHLLLIRGVIKHRNDANISGNFRLRNGIRI